MSVTVAELIARLQLEPQDAKVQVRYFDNYEGAPAVEEDLTVEAAATVTHKLTWRDGVSDYTETVVTIAL